MASTRAGSSPSSCAPSWNSGLFATTAAVAILPSTSRAKPSSRAERGRKREIIHRPKRMSYSRADWNGGRERVSL